MRLARSVAWRHKGSSHQRGGVVDRTPRNRPLSMECAGWAALRLLALILVAGPMVLSAATVSAQPDDSVTYGLVAVLNLPPAVSAQSVTISVADHVAPSAGSVDIPIAVDGVNGLGPVQLELL